MTPPISIQLQRPPAAEPDQPPLLPPARHLIHASGCPVYVWWAHGKRQNRAGRHWCCWFVYLEYRLANGDNAYVQQELGIDRVGDPELWQRLARTPLPGASCVARSLSAS
ncbi:MAG: hypothetical protein V7629_15230 [Motiliproteus sp.]